MDTGSFMEAITGNLSTQSILSYILGLPKQEQERIFKELGVKDEDALRYFVRGNDEEQFTLQYPEYRAHKILMVYIPPILLVLGTFGNIFSFLIMRHKSMTRMSTYIFLAALSVVDSMVLFIGLLREWLGELTHFDIKDQASWLCKTVVMLGYTSSNISVWIIVAVTIERYIVVSYPLKAQRFCNVTRAKKIIGGLVFIFIAINIHFMWTVGLHDTDVKGSVVPRCNGLEGYKFLVSEVWPWVDALIYSFVPFVVISVFNILIVCKVARANHGRGDLQNGGLKLRNRCKEETKNRLTIMLLTVSFTFLLTTLPMNISLIASAFWNSKGHDNAEMSKYRLVVTITTLLMYLNHSINFFLYCATGQKFRNEVIRMFCGKNNNNLATADHSQHLYCSRGCPHEVALDIRKSMDETEM